MKTYVTVLLALSAFAFGIVQTDDVEDSTYCESYNEFTCNEKNKENCVTQEKCEPTGPDIHNHCFALWEFNAETGVSNVQIKGCFLNNKDCYEKSHCVQKNKDETNQLYFCCCNGNMCNKNFTYTKFMENREKVFIDAEIDGLTTTEEQIFSLIMAVSAFVLVIAISFITWYYRHRKLDYNNEVSKVERGENHKHDQHPQNPCQSTSSSDSCSSSSTLANLKPVPLVMELELLEKLAPGHFGGAVWLARRKTDGADDDGRLACKVFPLRDRQSWRTELEIFQLPRMQHEDVIRFIGAHRRGEGLRAEFLLLTEWQEKGSLCDYLRENTLDWEEMKKIVISIARGLDHLHSELSGGDEHEVKPALAHRDFKSSNVLLGRDMSARIADFGLALVFRPKNGVCGKQHGRVGTLRYMAPELLDGAINFTRESFLAIDMYACGLVLWELASRCDVKEDSVNDYKLPFEKEVGLQPTLEEMQECAVVQKTRPCIPETWKRHKGLSSICETIEECWDHDADARLSSSCVLDRIISLKK